VTSSNVEEQAFERVQVDALLGATGRSLDDWIVILERGAPLAEEPRAHWLREEHRLPEDIAETIARAAAERSADEVLDPKALIAAQYDGELKGARVIYDRLAQAVKACGKDAKVDVRRSHVSLLRRRQFGLITPGPGKGLTLGLVLPGSVQSERLIPKGRVHGERITHTVALRSRTEVDAEITAWIRAAFEASS
jgi:hypothetical protein